MIHKTHISQIGENYTIFNLKKNDLKKINYVNMNKSPRRIRSHDLRYINPIH